MHARPAGREAKPVKEWQLLAVLAGAQFTHIVDFMIMMPLGPQFMRIFAVSPRQFAFLVSAYTFAAAASGFFAAFRLDRYDRKAALRVIYGAFTIATLLCALAPGFYALLAARAAAGIFGGVLNAIVHSIIGDAVPVERRGRATGTVMMAFSLAAVAGVPLGLTLATWINWRAPFVAVAVVSAVIWLIATKMLTPMRRHIVPGQATQPMERLRAVFGDRNHVAALSLTGVLMFAGFSMIPFISPYLVANVGVLESQLPYVYLAGGGATLFTSRAIGWLADRYGKRRMFAIIALLSIVPILLVSNLGRMPLVAVLAATTLFFILVSGRFVPAMALINSSVQSRHRGSFLSFNASIQSVASGLGSFGAGLVIGKAADGALLHYWMVGLFAACMTVVAVLLSRRVKLVPDS
jgi:predicted MFS family arabinose efflux permease